MGENCTHSAGSVTRGPEFVLSQLFHAHMQTHSEEYKVCERGEKHQQNSGETFQPCVATSAPGSDSEVWASMTTGENASCSANNKTQ